MMKRLLLASVLAAPAAWAGDTQLTIKGPDGLTGTATLVNRLMPDGTKYVRLTMKLSFTDGQSSEILQESSYQPDGEPTRMLQTTKSGSKKTSVVVTFSEEGAQVVTGTGSATKSNLVVRPDGPVANPTEFWFLKSRPKVGETANFMAFRVSEQAWAKAKATYRGVKDIVVAGKAVKANLVETGEIKSYVDDAGDPYRIEIGGMVLERAPKG